MEKHIIPHEAISALCLELSMLFHAGVGAGDALTLLAEESDPAYRPMISAMAEQVDFGSPLSAAMRKTERFPAYVCGLIEVGERAGRAEEALAALAQYYESRARLDRRIKSALLYPAVMLLLMLVVIAVLLVRVLPIFNDVYASLGGRLTGVAGGLLALGRWLDGAMPVLWVLLAAVCALLAAFAAVPSFRDRLTALWRNSRGDKGISRKMNDARLAQALSMGMASGMPLEEAVELASGLMEDTPQAKVRCQACQDQLNQGAKVSAAMKESGLLPASACRLLELGQQSGTGDAAMEKIAADLAEESELALEDRVSRVEPALVLVCSLLVGLILLSVMLPLMHIMSAIG
ncbi:MAG: type II secretion system F family protein [Oscillospiraceae bacterium]|nr:type II secretion system F family protein [Oscillospiraceae bacterium]